MPAIAEKPPVKTSAQIAAEKDAAMTPEARKEAVDFIFNPANRGPKPPETDAEKVQRESDEQIAAEKKTADEAKAKGDAEAKAEKPVKEKPEKAKSAPAAEEVKPAPAKRVIKRAPGYEDVAPVTEAVNKLTAVAEKMAAAAEKPAEKAKPANTLTDAEKNYVKAMSVLPDLFPNKPEYKGASERAEKYLAELPAFEEKFDQTFRLRWEKTHAENYESDADRETAFNEARQSALAAESDKFRAKFKIDIDPDDMLEARVELRVRPVEERVKGTEAAASRLSEEKRQESLVPVAEAAAGRAVDDFKAKLPDVLGAEVASLIKDDWSIDKAVADKLPDGDIVSEVVSGALAYSARFAEAAQLFISGAKTPMAKEVQEFCLAEENYWAGRKPGDADYEDGKSFARGSEYAKMSKADQAKHWVLDVDTIIALKNQLVMQRAAQVIESKKGELAKLMEKRGVKPAAPETAAPKPKSPAAADPIAGGKKIDPNAGSADGGWIFRRNT